MNWLWANTKQNQSTTNCRMLHTKQLTLKSVAMSLYGIRETFNCTRHFKLWIFISCIQNVGKDDCINKEIWWEICVKQRWYIKVQWLVLIKVMWPLHNCLVASVHTHSIYSNYIIIHTYPQTVNTQCKLLECKCIFCTSGWTNTIQGKLPKVIPPCV